MTERLWPDDVWLLARLHQGLVEIARLGPVLLDARLDPHAQQRVFAVHGLAELRSQVRDEVDWARTAFREPHDPAVPLRRYRDLAMDLDFALSAALALYDAQDAETGYYEWLDAAARAQVRLAALAESLNEWPPSTHPGEDS